MAVKVGRTFVYGDFEIPDQLYSVLPPLPPIGGPKFAIEITREYSANEFVGKLYKRAAAGSWVPVDPSELSSEEWRQRLSKKHDLKFKMEGSGLWKVLHFRTESDETGPYVAIALQYAE
jgi:hypothetical protein